MRKFIFLILVLSSFISRGQSPDKFEFFFTERKDKIPNTYSSADDLYMRDMLVDPPQKIIIKLTQKERDDILKKVQSMDFFNYPDVYKFESADAAKQPTLAQPCPQFTLTVFLHGESKYVSWNNCRTGVPSMNNVFENLEELRAIIESCLYSKDSYKNSKAPRVSHF
jgi:hypothetical protein